MAFWQRMTLASQGAAVADAASASGRASLAEMDPGQQRRLAEYLQATPGAPAPPVSCPERQAAVASSEADVLDEYERLAAGIGFAPVALRVERMRMLLAELGLYIYERAKVEAYLTSKFGREKHFEMNQSATWCWRPMRAADLAVTKQQPVVDETGTPSGWITVGSTFGGTVFNQPSVPSVLVNGQVLRVGPTYAKPVPMPVLATVARLLEKVPDAKFFISDETTLAERFKDPFLAVQLPGSEELYVIERWDEPSFRG